MVLNKNKLQLKLFKIGFNNRDINGNRGYLYYTIVMLKNSLLSPNKTFKK